MLRRELPLEASHGRLIRVAAGRIAPGLDDSPLQPEQPWPESVQPLAYWHDEPIALSVEEQAGEDWPDGRQWLSRLPESWFPLISTALQVAAWLRDHRYCGRCGAPASRLDAEFAMHCEQCGHRNYPRISPCIITLVTHGDAMLLARSPRFPPGRYSTLAGFIEPGESAEEAVHREVYEEVGVSVGRIRYYRSQAWPFPHALMLGFFAEAASRRIRIDGIEIADAAWFLPSRLPQLPPPYSISRALIETHLAEVANGAGQTGRLK
ncbi:NAD(+) diphosphatase [Billgrantia tianxiuensis]|jgi:NAD+ diphosphatase|uniref:NAD(+) diphosphatase n=1 Tax=Billgrantia tianxiuensis TaxID=2497861 RepID=A0A6I6SKP4_9GAMM|nr:MULTISPECIES: NAD(+) diphosphatase [Halomonas]MCE8031766.1 NAD(+) diphosphatase [Halomonas sp. MCCC 1A11057]QHC50122.1 NAD(+) diphosphatase [Halomonas tianxiuensis]